MGLLGKLTDKVTDIVASEVLGKEMKTVYVSLEEFTALLEQTFLSAARSAADLTILTAAVSGKRLKGTPEGFEIVMNGLDTKDERYRLKVTKASLVNLQKYEAMIADYEEGKFYTFKGGYGKEPILAMEAKIESYQKNFS